MPLTECILQGPFHSANLNLVSNLNISLGALFPFSFLDRCFFVVCLFVCLFVFVVVFFVLFCFVFFLFFFTHKSVTRGRRHAC